MKKSPWQKRRKQQIRLTEPKKVNLKNEHNNKIFNVKSK